MHFKLSHNFKDVLNMKHSRIITVVCLLTAVTLFGKPADDVRPRVLLIGDSISIGYIESVRELLKDEAEVHGLPIATKSSTQGLAEIDEHLTKMRWDVIHFNWGLNDLEHFGTGKHRVPLDLYEKNLTKLVDKLEKTGAVLIWATTTPIPKGTGTRTHGDAVKYNAVAAKVLQGRSIRINDLYSFALARLANIQKQADVHYTADGYAVLGGEVAQSVQLALATTARQLFTSRSIDIGLQKQLLVDDYVIAQKHNITRELGKPRKIGVVMKPSLPTDFHPTKQFPDGLPKTGYHGVGYRTTVLWNEQQEIFQMLYRASAENLTAYAESKDGINWTKPFIADDGKSNLITYRGKTRGTFYEASFTIDPTVPWGHPEKFKAAYNPGDPWDSEAAIAHSSDGIHWRGYNKGEPVTGRAADTHNQILWDPIGNRYLLLTRTDLGAEGGKNEDRATRIMAHDKGNDLLRYPKAWKTLTTVTVDDPQGKKTSSGVTALQMEAMTVWVYENVYFGLTHVLTAGDLMGGEGGGDDRDLDARPETDVIDFYIGTSRDAVNFDKSWVHARKPLIERGDVGSFDKAMVVATSEIITRGDEHWIYYQGEDCQHHGARSAKSKGGRIGLATLPLDRFICQQAKGKLGTITTKPFKLQGDTLQVNVDAGKGRFYAEVLDADGKAIPGFTVNEAEVFSGVDELRLQPQWKNKDLSALKGKTIRLKFYLKNAKLYAFQIRSQSGNTNQNKTVSIPVWQNSDPSYDNFRIPSIIVTQKGTVLAFAEGRSNDSDGGDIDLLVKRSTDNGKTWSKQLVVWDDKDNTCGNPCPVIDKTTGRIILFMTWNPGTSDEAKAVAGRRPHMCYSDDDGLSWSKPVDLTLTCKDPTWLWYATGPGIAIQLKSEKYKNRIVIPANHSYPTNNKDEKVAWGDYGYGAHVLLSDDGGATWRKSESITPGCNESQVIELSDGRLMMNMRSYNGFSSRAISYSEDGGETWSDIQHALQLADEQCQASIIEYGSYDGKKMYLFSNPGNPWDRVYMTIRTSFDDCDTWSNSKLIFAGPSSYSCMTVLPDGNIGLLFEGGKDFRYESLTFVSIHPDELFMPGTLLKSDQLP